MTPSPPARMKPSSAADAAYGVEYYYFPSPAPGHAMATDLTRRSSCLGHKRRILRRRNDTRHRRLHLADGLSAGQVSRRTSTDADVCGSWDGQSWTHSRHPPLTFDRRPRAHRPVWGYQHRHLDVARGSGIPMDTDIAFDDVWTWDGQQWNGRMTWPALSPMLAGGSPNPYDEQR